MMKHKKSLGLAKTADTRSLPCSGVRTPPPPPPPPPSSSSSSPSLLPYSASSPFLPITPSKYPEAELFQKSMLLHNSALYYALEEEQFRELVPVNGEFCKTSYCTAEMLAQMGSYVDMKLVSYTPPFREDPSNPSGSLAIAYRGTHIPGQSVSSLDPPIVASYDNTGYYVIVATGKSNQLYFSFMGSESQLHELAASHGFENYLAPFIESLGGIRMETTTQGLPNSAYPAYDHPAFMTVMKDELPDVVSFSHGACGKMITYKGHKYKVVCVENVELPEDEKKESEVHVDDDIPTFYESEALQKNYLLLEMNSRKRNTNITTMHVPVFEIDLLLKQQSQNSESKTKPSKKRRGTESSESESQSHPERKKTRSSMLRCSTINPFHPFRAHKDLEGSIEKELQEIFNVNVTKGATSSPQESNVSFTSPSIVVDRVMRDDNPSPPLEIQDIMKKMLKSDPTEEAMTRRFLGQNMVNAQKKQAILL